MPTLHDGTEVTALKAMWKGWWYVLEVLDCMKEW